MSATSILDRYPKKRPPLPAAFKKIYNLHYLSNRQAAYKTTVLSQKMEAWMHHQVVADVLASAQPKATLEIGAGTLNQLQYEPNNPQYDIVEPFKQLYAKSPWLKRVRRIYADIAHIKKAAYDRITTIATFEHIAELPDVVAKAATLLEPKKGQLRVGIPNEGTILWKLGTLFTGFEFQRRYGLDYQILMTHEHVNTADEIEAVLRCFFKKVDCRVLGLNKQFAFYRFYTCSLPKIALAKKYLQKRPV